MKLRMLFSTVLGLALAATGCADRQPLAPEQPEVSAKTPSAPTSTQYLEGEIGPGAKYAFVVPANWNGKLVLYAHGFHDAAEPIALPYKDQIEPLRDALSALGYAVGYSSYSQNGFAVKDGAQRTQQLRGIFVSKFGKPTQTYLAGHSLGGLIATMLAEKHPNHYSGALAMCGMVGGSQAQVDYIAHIRVLFDFFFPNVLPGSLLDLDGATPQQIQALAVGAMMTDLSSSLPKLMAIRQIMAAQGMPIPVIDVNQSLMVNTLIQSIATALVFHARGIDDLYDRTHRHSPFDNRSTVYAGLPSPLIDAVNAGVARYDIAPDAQNYLRNWYQPTGDLDIPLLTLHNRYDPVVPQWHETRYAAAAAQAGSSNLLVQRTALAPYGHCVFTIDEMVRALQDLVNWAENGIKPAGN